MIWIYILAFFIGFDSISTVTQTILRKEFYHLTAPQWASIGVIFGLPWSIKVLYSLLIEGSRKGRSGFVGLGGLLMLSSVILQLLLLNNILDSQYQILAISSFLYSSGMVMMDIITDTRMIDIAGKDVNYLGKSALTQRICMIIGGLLASLLTTWLSSFPTNIAIGTKLILPITIILYSLFSTDMLQNSRGISNYLKLLGIGFAILAFPALYFEQQFLFMVLTLVFIYLYVSKEVTITKEFAFSCFAVFCFRVIPSPGVGYDWWLMHLGADASYFGNLAIIGNIFTIVGLAGLSRVIIHAPLHKSLILLTLLDLLLSAPSLLVYYFGYNYHYFILFEASASAMLGSVAMIPLHILLSKSAPEHGRVVYVAATASFVNLALSVGSIISKWLSEYFVVTIDNFDQMGLLLLYCTLVSLIFSILGIVLLRRCK